MRQAFQSSAVCTLCIAAAGGQVERRGQHSRVHSRVESSSGSLAGIGLSAARWTGYLRLQGADLRTLADFLSMSYGQLRLQVVTTPINAN